MVNVGSFDAKTHLPALLERVLKGEVIQITRRGVPVAKLVPVDQQKARDFKEATRCIREARKGILLRGLRIKDMIREGRR
ncbi:MAG: type II toxin-antitoxin system prevent-host-death family antitoxin [Candidatus Omnitrophica bacterium]|nr:type II toxin-antitoxin system prevent-host-death family antitoxin [Candidatus Omnitrophota bacterium]